MVKFKKITEGAKNIMNDQSIINLIEITLEEKMNENDEFIKYTFYELRVKYNLSEQDTERFLELIRIKLLNEKYQVYFKGAKFEYKEQKITVGNNELMVAVKEK